MSRNKQLKQMGILYLVLSSLSESIWNIFLAKSKGLGDWRLNTPGIFLIICATVLFKRALATIPLSIAITVWSGFSILLSISFDLYFLKTRIDLTTAFFMALCIGSIIALNYFSKAH